MDPTRTRKLTKFFSGEKTLHVYLSVIEVDLVRKSKSDCFRSSKNQVQINHPLHNISWSQNTRSEIHVELNAIAVRGRRAESLEW